MSNAIQVRLDMQGIEILEGDVWGRRKDLDEYFTVEDAIMEEICALAASGMAMMKLQLRSRRRQGSDQI